MRTEHNWPGTYRALRAVPMSDDELDEEVAANRSRFDEHATPIRTRSTDRAWPNTGRRLAPLRRAPILVGGGLLRGAWLIVRDMWRWVAGPSALVRVKRGGRK